jgi:hypothetical protein
MPARHVNRKPRLFRTWKSDKSPGYNALIWEAGRATSAAPPFFKRILIGNPGLQEEFIDGALGCNNPVLSLVEEARREFEPNTKVGCIVSIGTGKPKVAEFKKPGHIQRMLPAAMHQWWKPGIKIVLDSIIDSMLKRVSKKSPSRNGRSWLKSRRRLWHISKPETPIGELTKSWILYWESQPTSILWVE